MSDSMNRRLLEKRMREQTRCFIGRGNVSTEENGILQSSWSAYFGT